MIKNGQLAAVLAVSMAASLWGADEGNWANLGGLKRGDRVGVVQSDMKRVEGRFAGYNDAGISIEGDITATVDRARVVRVYRRPRTKRMVRAVIGAGAGVAAGAILGETVGTRFRNEGGDSPTGLWIAGAAGVGAGIGALSGGGYQTIYRGPAPKSP